MLVVISLALFCSATAQAIPSLLPFDPTWTWQLSSMCDLIKAGADINAKDEQGLTPLMHAIEVTRGISIDAIRLLVLAGADVNAIDKEGRTPLSFAMSQDRQDIIRVLLDAGADPAPMRAAQQKALDDFLSGTMFHLEGLTVHQTLEVWDLCIAIISANSNTDLSKAEAAYVLPAFHFANPHYATTVGLSRYFVAKQMIQPDPDDVFRSRIALLKDYSPAYTQLSYALDLMQAGEASLPQTYQWLTYELEIWKSKGH